jgi:hypothetical protein
MCSENQIASNLCETSFLSEPVKSTGGKLYFITGHMSIEENVYRLEQQLLYDLDNIAGSEVVVKVRTGIGFRTESYIGHGVYFDSRNEVELCGVSTDTSFTFLFKHDAVIKDEVFISN